jgi:hypothetical protein
MTTRLAAHAQRGRHLVPLALWALAGCHGGGAMEPIDAGSVADMASDAGCVLGSVPLLVDSDGSVASRLHVAVEHAGAPAAMLLDTGSGTTFLQEPLGSPDPVPHAGVIQLGCRSLTLDGRPEVPDDPVQGVPSIGTIGADLFLSGPSQIDIGGARLLLQERGSTIAGTAGWPGAPFDDVSGLVLAHVSLDGNPVRLMVDTGSPHVLWLGQAPQPGDVPVDTSDAQGNVVHLYYGTAVLSVGGTDRTVPVLRAPSFPYFEGTVKALGGNVQGLLGLSAVGAGIVFDPDAGVIRIAP